jgi:hypothetical protein
LTLRSESAGAEEKTASTRPLVFCLIFGATRLLRNCANSAIRQGAGVQGPVGLSPVRMGEDVVTAGRVTLWQAGAEEWGQDRPCADEGVACGTSAPVTGLSRSIPPTHFLRGRQDPIRAESMRGAASPFLLLSSPVCCLL